jgi:hypothetical protein
VIIGTVADPVVPIVTTRDDARRAAAEELAKPVYAHARPGAAHRVLDWIGGKIDDFLARLFSDSAGGGGGGWWAMVALVALLVGVVILIRWKYGPVRRSSKADKLLFDESAPLDAAGYRKASEDFAASGVWAEAVRARLRAIIASLEERTVLQPRPGRTADVAAREAGKALPGEAAALIDAARIFDDIWYGEAEARGEDYQRVKAVDEAVALTKPRHEAGADAMASAGSSSAAGAGEL